MNRLGTSPAVLCLLLLTPALEAQSFLDWKGLKAGPHGVGFRAVATADATRSFQTPTDYFGRPRPGFGNRPVQVSVWYPAQKDPGAAPMTYGDYVALLAWELGPARTGEADRQSAREQFIRMSGLPVTPQGRAAFERLWAEKVWATRDAKPAPGKFPVLISAPGQGYPAFDNSVMAEFLASHGFVVLAAPSAGSDGRDMPGGPLAMETGSRDMEYLLGFAQALAQVDPDRVAAMGFSLGGSSAALFALRNARVKALVSLDGVLRDDRTLTELKVFPWFLPGRLRAPLLWIACGPGNSLPGFGEGSFPEEARYAEVVKAVFPGLLHHDFSSMSSLQRRRAQDATKDWTSATASYEAASRLILAFLQSRLNGVERGLDQEPANLCRVTSRPARKAPPTPMDFRETAARDGFASASELVQTVRREAPDSLPLFEEPMVLLGYEALGASDTKLALQVFALTVETFPDSIDGSYGLGKACVAEGFLEDAELHYGAARSKVEKDPNLPAAQKEGILGRIDAILADLRAKRGAKP
jgi:dienelactone hydrolase